MSRFEAMIDTAINAIDIYVSELEVEVDSFSGSELKQVIADSIGYGYAQTILDELYARNMLSQISAVTDEHGGEWQFTKNFIEALDKDVGSGKADSSPSDLHTERGGYSEFKDRLLIAIAEYEEKFGSNYYEPAEIAEEAGLDFRKGWVRKAAISFRDYGYVSEAFSLGGGEDRGLDCQLTGQGLEEAERLRSIYFPISSVPASDRTVTNRDNVWNEPDYVGELEPEKEEEIRNLIKLAIAELPNAGLSNADQSQASAQLEAAEKLANAPVPKWGKVKEILEPLAQIAAIGGLIVAIIALIV
ncbi:hypothetical protein RJ527_05105 [Thalassospiraceae bacterium LMO-SO8]|nr:hypothetical protein [Alphaproteobacteria bacterium LMO-S08]WND77124.1 hypothetical protein RJ527_05105 [Thalassospiraceae bacterium LMO-SO8]